jgi:hypothetical protein
VRCSSGLPRRSAAQACELGVGRGFVDEDEAVRHFPHDRQPLRDPDAAELGDVSAIALGCQQRFFLKLKPALHKKRESEAGSAVTPNFASSAAASSDMVMSGVSLTRPMRKSR